MKCKPVLSTLIILILLWGAVSCGRYSSPLLLALTQTALAPQVQTRVAAELPTPPPIDWSDLLRENPTSVAGSLGILAPTKTPEALPFGSELSTPLPTPTYPLDLFPPTNTPNLIQTRTPFPKPT